MKRYLFFLITLFAIDSVLLAAGQRPVLELEKGKVFVVQKDYDLKGSTISVPDGCVLKFEGGSISNGTLSSLVPFSVDANLIQIFHDVKFDVKNRSTLKLYAEWFGVNRWNVDSINSINLQRLFDSCKNLRNTHIVFQDGIYKFDINHPIKARGRFNITGECTGGFVDPPRTQFNICGYPENSQFFLTIDTDGSSFKNICFFCPNGNDYNKFGNIGALFVKDGISPGDIDTAIDGCVFLNLGCSIKAYGRGLSFTNSKIMSGGGIVLKQTKSVDKRPTQQPPFDGRGLFINNIRAHWITRGVHSTGIYNGFGVKDNTLITIQHNNEIDNSTYFGVIIDNIYSDGSCQLLDCDSEMNGLILTNVFCARPLNNFLHFKRNVSNLILTNMVCDNAYLFSSQYSGEHLISFDGNVENSIISDNIFGPMKGEQILVAGNNRRKMNNCVITSNIFKGGLSILGLENVDVSFLKFRNNIIEHTNLFEQEIRILGDRKDTSILNSIIDN